VIEPAAVPATESRSARLIRRIYRYRRLLQIKPFDTSTPEGRSSERYRRVAWSTTMSLVARVLGLATSLISVPLVLGYLQTERYGMWLTISSTVAALGPLDLGIGLGLLTVVADAYGRDDREAARRAISTAIAMLSLISVVALVIFGLVYFAIPWSSVFGVKSPTAVAEVGPTVAVVFVAFAMGLPLSVVGQIQMAHQSGYVSSGWAIVGNIGSLLALILIITMHGSLPVLVAALTGVGLIAALLNGVVLFGKQRPWLRPRLNEVDFRTARPLLKTGSFFLLLQLSGLAAYNLDNFIISQILGAKAVPEYALPGKLFYLAPTLLGYVLSPLWPAYRESIARGDVPWVKRTLRRSIMLAASINIPNTIFMVIAAPFILDIWLPAGDKVHPTTLLLLGFGAWTLINTLNGPFAILFNGANIVGFQAGCSVLMATANVIISVYLIQRIGVAGAVYGSVISQVIFVLIPDLWYMRRLLRRLEVGRAASGTAADTGP
jgi:O-antigen/teichoic acid export membrane protein